MHIMVACRAIDRMAGGVERQAIALLNDMHARGHRVSLLTWDPADAEAFYPISPGIDWIKLDMGSPKQKAGWGLRAKRAVRVRALVKAKKPDIILAFQQGMFLTLRLYLWGMGVPVIASERESPYRYAYVEEGRHKDVIFQSYRLAPSITVQCESYINGYPSYLRSRIRVIPNAVPPNAPNPEAQQEQRRSRTILCVGRLCWQKNQICLLRAFAQVQEEFPERNVALVGEGDLGAEIAAEISILGLQARVRLRGPVQNISAEYYSASFLCIPSLWEGFPNVLGEALAHGLPAVGFQGCGGVRDLIIPERNGLLAAGENDPFTLANALRCMMGEEDARLQMQAQAAASIEVFHPKAIYDRWEAFFQEVQRV